jgi:hypothetical protein
VAALWHPNAYSERTTAGILNEIEVAARTLGMQLQLVPAVSPDDLAGAFTAITREHADALIVLPSPMLFGEYRRIVSIAASSRLPAMGAAREFVDFGGLMSYGVNLPDLARQTATYVDKIPSLHDPKETVDGFSISMFRTITASLFYDLVGAQKERLGDGQAGRLGGGQVDDEIELGRLLDREVGGIRTTQNLVDMVSRAPEQVREVWSIGHETSSLDVLPKSVHRRQACGERMRGGVRRAFGQRRYCRTADVHRRTFRELRAT